jgi:Flp pilus assembly secretin CpaC
MKICWIFVYLITLSGAFAQVDAPLRVLPEGRIVRLTLDTQIVTVLHLRVGYVSTVRLPEDVSSVVLGDPSIFKAEHSDSEPRLVFLKPIAFPAGETNVLITTKTGREISLHLISAGNSDRGAVDFVLEYDNPRGFFIELSYSGFVIADTQNLSANSMPTTLESSMSTTSNQELLEQQQAERHPHWQGKQLRVALGKVNEDNQQMTLVFSVLNASSRTIEILPPQIQLAGSSNNRHGKPLKADQVAVKNYAITARRLPPRGRADGIVVFERPSFKESRDQMLLQVAQAEEVDRPVLVPIPFVAPLDGGSK